MTNIAALGTGMVGGDCYRFGGYHDVQRFRDVFADVAPFAGRLG